MGAWTRLAAPGPGGAGRGARAAFRDRAGHPAHREVDRARRAGGRPACHAGITLPTALLMCAFCLLATVPAGWLRPLPAALAVYAGGPAVACPVRAGDDRGGGRAAGDRVPAGAQRVGGPGRRAGRAVPRPRAGAGGPAPAGSGAGRAGRVRPVGRGGHRHPGAGGAAGGGDPGRGGGRAGAGGARADRDPQRRPRAHRGDAGRSPGPGGAGQDRPRAARRGRAPHLDDRGAGGDRPADHAGAAGRGRAAVRRDRRHRPGRADRDAPPARRAP